MVAYNFQARFTEPIRSGAKTNTIRRNAKRRHARRGEKLQLYTGMRTRSCTKIVEPDPTCTQVKQIRISVGADRLESIQLDGAFIEDLDGFAQSDGFMNAKDMHGFWLATHGEGLFEGTFISWGEQ